MSKLTFLFMSILPLSWALCGCIQLTGTVYKAVPDPRANEFVKVVDVSGATLILADGSRYRILGIELEPSDKAKEMFQQELRRMMIHHDGVLLDKYGDAAIVTLSGGHYLGGRPFGFILFPKIEKRPPERMDVGRFLVHEGYAKANLAEIPNDELRKEYEAAEANARRYRQRVGIWKECPSTTQSVLER